MSTNQPVVSIDPVPFILDGMGHVCVALCKRRYEPEAGAWALPGVMLQADDSAAKSARSAVRLKLGLSVKNITSQYPGSYNDDSNRDPRGATISLTQIMTLDPQARFGKPVDLRRFKDTHDLPFAHGAIIRAAVERHLATLHDDPRRVADLLGPSFTTAQFRAVYADFGYEMRPGAAHRTCATMFTEAGRESSGRGKPSVLWSL